MNDYDQEFTQAWDRTPAIRARALPPIRLQVRKDCIDQPGRGALRLPRRLHQRGDSSDRHRHFDANSGREAIRPQRLGGYFCPLIFIWN